jgi:hypothetical protein
MAKKEELPQDLVDRLAREKNKEDREIVAAPARAIAEGAQKMYRAATGKNPDTGEKETGFRPRNIATTGDEEMYDTNPVRSPVDTGMGVRAPNMGKKSKVGKAMKSGGTVSSASKRADGCAIKGKTRGKMV